ncbi:MAG: photosynthetic complex assembly protein PuhC [Rhodospirillales bacterium]|jgi:putative photosynthetic complex assembly protein
MTTAAADRTFPPAAILVGAALIAASLLAAVLWRDGGQGGTTAATVAQRELHFADGADGSVIVTDARTGRTVQTVPPGAGGFVRGVLRGFARERRRSDMGPETPFVLSRHADGRFLLTDPLTGRVVDVGVFGPDNSAAFARLMAP